MESKGYMIMKKCEINGVYKAFFSIICILAPVLQQYSFFGVSWLIWGLLIMLPAGVLVLCDKKGIVVEREMVFLLGFLILYTCVAIMNRQNVLGILQNIFLVGMVAFFVPNLINYETVEKSYKFICIFATIYAMLQLYAARQFHFYLSGAFPIGNSPQTVFANEIKNGATNALIGLRPRSIFSEPSGYGIYVALFLILLLCNKNLDKGKSVLAIFLSLGLICARSSTGILLMLLAWIVFCLRVIKSGKTNKYVAILMIVIISIAIGGSILSLESFEVFFDHTFSEKGGTYGRLAGYLYALDINNYSVRELLFGHGVIKNFSTVFVAGWGRILYYFGICGILVYILLLCSYWMRGNTRQKLLIAVLALYNFFSATLYSVDIIWWWSVYFALGDSKSENIVQV